MKAFTVQIKPLLGTVAIWKLINSTLANARQSYWSRWDLVEAHAISFILESFTNKSNIQNIFSPVCLNCISDTRKQYQACNKQAYCKQLKHIQIYFNLTNSLIQCKNLRVFRHFVGILQLLRTVQLCK